MRGERRRKLSNSAWIILRSNDYPVNEGVYGYPGFKQELLGVGSVAVPLDKKEDSFKLSWSDIGLSNEQRPYAFKDSYKPAEVYQYNEKEDYGINLVLTQYINDDIEPQWHLNQDLILALNLIREGDTWLAPQQQYEEVVKLKRDGKNPASISIKADYLRDYLCARNMCLRISVYRERIATFKDANFIDWKDGKLLENIENETYEGRYWDILPGGKRPSTDVSVMKVRRTDVDFEEDIPVFSDKNNNTDYESTTYTITGNETFCMVHGAYWQEDVVEPAALSPIVRRDETPPAYHFITDVSGTKESKLTLKNEEIGKYLWFKPEIIPRLINIRGAKNEWYTRYTGSINPSYGYRCHYGVNKVGLVNVYAYDIAKLPDWLQAIWAGYNVAPNEGVCAELLQAQMSCEPASTTAPETLLLASIDELADAFSQKYGKNIFRHHENIESIKNIITRLRAVDNASLFNLAKDIYRACVETMDNSILVSILAQTKDNKKGSLKNLEELSSTLTTKTDCRSLFSPLHGLSTLRQSDAHLPSCEIDEALNQVWCKPEMPYVIKAEHMLASVAYTLHFVAEILLGNEEHCSRRYPSK